MHAAPPPQDFIRSLNAVEDVGGKIIHDPPTAMPPTSPPKVRAQLRDRRSKQSLDQ
jgi:hypothetical protein